MSLHKSDTCPDLLDWLKSLQMEEYFHKFLKEELYLDLLLEIPEDKLDATFETLKSFEVPTGARFRIKKSLAKLKEKKEIENIGILNSPEKPKKTGWITHG